ncbi:MAG TPA: tetratricopeptide repeat protein [Pyrinomonadaceae bacterium]
MMPRFLIDANVRRWLLPVSVFCLLLSHSHGASSAVAPPANLPVSASCEQPEIQEQKPVAKRKELGLLRPGEISRQAMDGGETHVFRVSLKQGQYLRVIVQQEDIDVAVSFYEPDQLQAFVQMDSPNGSRGPESVSIIARVTGDYLLETRSEEKGAMAGRYELSSDGPREPVAADLKRVAAEAAFLEGRRLRRLGTAESRRQALEKYDEAVKLWQSLGDGYQEAYALHSMGLVYRALADLEQARKHFEQAIAIWQKEKNLYGWAFTLNELGSTVRDLDSPQNALPFYQQAHKLYEQIGSPWWQAYQQNNIGYAYALQGRHREALEYYGRAVALWHDAGDRNMEANGLNNIGGSLERLGDLPKALANYQAAVRLWQETENLAKLAIAYNNIGVIYHSFGDSEEAFTNYHNALALHRQLKNERGEANTLDNIGMIYADWGEPLKAQEYFNEALPIRQRLKEPRGHALTLDNMGFVNYLLGNYQDALGNYQQALPLSRQAQDMQGLAFTLTHIGIVHSASGDPQKALEYYQQALQLQKESEYKLGQAVTLDKIAQAYLLLGDAAKAESFFKEALALWSGLEDRQGEASALYGLALVESARGNLAEASRKIEQSIVIVENLRTRTSSQQLRATYLASKQSYYELDIDVKMRLHQLNPSGGYMAAALEASERARARGLLDILSEGHADIRQWGDPRLIAQQEELEERLNAIANRLLLLRGAKARPDDAALVALEVETLTRDFDLLSNQYEDVQARIRTTSPRYAQLMQPQPLGLASVQQLLDDNTLLLEYALGDKRSYLWAVTRSGIEGYQLPARAEIEKAANSLRELLTVYESAKPGESDIQYVKRLTASAALYRQHAAELGRIVLGPVAAQLGTKRLVIVADGALQFIPFEALIEPDAPESKTAAATFSAHADEASLPSVLLRHEVVYLPSASTLGLARAVARKPAAKSVAVFADPVFESSDERVSAINRKAVPTQPSPARPGEASRSSTYIDAMGGGLKLDRLRRSLDEANEIISVVPAGSGMKATGFGANRALATSASIGNYRIVHFATHAILNDKRPNLSCLVLSLIDEQGRPQDGFLRLHDIYNLNLPVELVVLSACRTGIGKEVRGEGLIGLTRGFMYAGAPKVIASLWKVDDEASAVLMKSFYQHLLRERLPAATALALAKKDVMRARDQWRAPYYWAGFVLQGDWK